MNVGDSIGGNITVPAGGNVGIYPTDGTTWLIQNISLTGPFKLAFASTHATYAILSAVATENVTFLNNLLLYCNSSNYWMIYNTDSVDHDFTYNGIIINDGTNGAITVGSLSTLANGQSMTIQPPAGQEWEINEIIHSGGSGTIFWMPEYKSISAIVANSWFNNLTLAITNSHYLQITNNSGGTYYYAYSGRRTK
jgi:hypothetical protein